MLLKQIEYFLAVVETGNFTKAGERCHISQSAVSQQIKQLEHELGVPLLVRHHRTFSLTPAGELFYRKSTVILNDLQQLKTDVINLDHNDVHILRIGNPKSYGGSELQDAVAEFSSLYPTVRLEVITGNHEDLYDALRRGDADLVMNDQRRAFSDDYINYELVRCSCYIEISTHHPFARLDRLDVSDLKNTTCILVAGKQQEQNESGYYRDIIGFSGDHIYAETLTDARILVASGRGFVPVDGIRENVYYDSSIARIPLYKKEQPVLRNYCAFWKQDNSGYYIEEFAQILKKQFEQI